MTSFFHPPTSASALAPLLARARYAGQTLVLATGFFDCLHQEHINFLRRARQVGDLLIVGVESDARARALKGPTRPLQSQAVRLAAVAPYADYLLKLPPSFNSPSAYERLIARLRPHILAVSSHSPHLKAKAALLARYGGRLQIVHQHNPAISTTQLLKQGILPSTRP